MSSRNVSHLSVVHPSQLLQKAKQQKGFWLKINEAVLEWITDHILGSVLLFDIALIIPLLTLNAPDSIKITLGVISGSWIQWWALPALQRSQNKQQALTEAKAEVDHETLTYLATLQDEQIQELKLQTNILLSMQNSDIVTKKGD